MHWTNELLVYRTPNPNPSLLVHSPDSPLVHAIVAPVNLVLLLVSRIMALYKFTYLLTYLVH